MHAHWWVAACVRVDVRGGNAQVEVRENELRGRRSPFASMISQNRTRGSFLWKALGSAHWPRRPAFVAQLSLSVRRRSARFVDGAVLGSSVSFQGENSHTATSKFHTLQLQKLKFPLPCILGLHLVRAHHARYSKSFAELSGQECEDRVSCSHCKAVKPLNRAIKASNRYTHLLRRYVLYHFISRYAFLRITYIMA